VVGKSRFWDVAAGDVVYLPLFLDRYSRSVMTSILRISKQCRFLRSWIS
jgi:hypothetical protein